MEPKTNGGGDESGPCPRLCHLIKWPDFDGYGFNLHAEKAKSGQYIGKVDADSPAELAGLREGDRIIEVNLVNISNENHRQVVERIKSIPNETKLLVVDELADKWYKERKIIVKSTQANVVHYKTPVPRPTATAITSNNNNNNNNTNNNNNNNYSEPIPTIGADDEPKVAVNGGSKEEDSEQIETVPEVPPHKTNDMNGGSETPPVVENGGNSSHGSTPKSANRSAVHSTETIQITRPSSSEGQTNTSIPGSPTSSKSGSSFSGPSRQTSDSGADLNLNMSASEMRQILAQRKKNDAKKAQMDLKQKYEIIEQM